MITQLVPLLPTGVDHTTTAIFSAPANAATLSGLLKKRTGLYHGLAQVCRNAHTSTRSDMHISFSLFLSLSAMSLPHHAHAHIYTGVAVSGNNGANTCPDGLTPIDSAAQCRKAAQQRGWEWSGQDTEAEFPKGCYLHSDADTEVLFNQHAVGSGESNSAPLCELRPRSGAQACRSAGRQTEACTQPSIKVVQQ